MGLISQNIKHENRETFAAQVQREHKWLHEVQYGINVEDCQHDKCKAEKKWEPNYKAVDIPYRKQRLS